MQRKDSAVMPLAHSDRLTPSNLLGSFANRARHGSPAYVLVNQLRLDTAAEREAIALGLLDDPARLPPKLFYDALGSTLYEAIVRTDEYYLTRAEQTIVAQHRLEIAATIGTGRQWVDLGSGDSTKAEAWFELARPSRYIAVDISATALCAALARLAGRADAPPLIGLVTDFSERLDVANLMTAEPALFHYPGSSIGNFMPEEALRLLTQIRAHCSGRGGGLLIGVDSQKEVARLKAAYDDALGVTAAFNRNILRHVNRLLGTRFDPADWRHVAHYDRGLARIEMHLEAQQAIEMAIGERRRCFARAERIHTENSYKYTREGFRRLLAEAGFSRVCCWTDEEESFYVFFAAAD